MKFHSILKSANQSCLKIYSEILFVESDPGQLDPEAWKLTYVFYCPKTTTPIKSRVNNNRVNARHTSLIIRNLFINKSMLFKPGLDLGLTHGAQVWPGLKKLKLSLKLQSLNNFAEKPEGQRPNLCPKFPQDSFCVTFSCAAG